jgi:DMSO reductase family type II enzyme chaperone
MIAATASSVRRCTDIARARLHVYRFLLSALDQPTREQHQWLASPAFDRALSTLCEQFGVPYPQGERVPADLADHESRYLASFEVGMPTAQVPLLASHYQRNEPVPRILHEHLLFYRRFGARLARWNREPADHVSNELAFLIHLDDLVQEGKYPVIPILRARRDFLTRHAQAWPARAARLAQQQDLSPLYQVLLSLLAAAVADDLALTEEILEQAEAEALVGRKGKHGPC